MIRGLVLEHSLNGRKYQVFLTQENWDKFNSVEDPQLRIFNLPKVLKIQESLVNELNFLIITNIIELP